MDVVSPRSEDTTSGLQMKSGTNVTAPASKLERANGHYMVDDGPDTADEKPVEQEVHQSKPIKFQLGKRLKLLNSENNYNENYNIMKMDKISTSEANNVISKRKKSYSNVTNTNDSKPKTFNDLEHSADKGHTNEKYGCAAIKKRKQEKGSQLKEYAQYLGLQPTVKFKCRKCCTMSFKSLGMLKEHQRICKWRAKGSTAAAGEGVDTPCRLTRKVYLCSACGTYYENWNLFLHMREVHDRHICLFCLGMFSKCEKLIAHLISKHNVKEHRYNDSKDFYSVYSGSLFMMCCQCNKIYTEKDNFTNHSCGVPKPKLVLSRVAKSINQVKNSTEKLESVNNSQISVPVRQPDISPRSLCTENEIIPLPQTTPSSSSIPKTTHKQVVSKSIIPVISPHTEAADMTISEMKKEVPIPEQIEPETGSLLSPRLLEPVKDKPVIQNNVEHWRNENNNTLVSETIKSTSISSTFIKNPSIAPVNPIQTSVLQTFDLPVTSLSKVPSRVRRVPKRYENEEPTVPNPTIKFKSTIYDNTVDETSLINRVPKLTVRVPKDLLDKPFSSDDPSSDSEGSTRLTVDDPQEIIADELDVDVQPELPLVPMPLSSVESAEEDSCRITTLMDDIVTAGNDVPLIELSLDRPLDKYPLKELIRLFLSVTIYNCIYCNHARKIAVDGEQLTLHLVAQHRFKATVDSITAEELLPEKITSRLKSCFTQLQDIFINMNSYDSEEKYEAVHFDRLYECFQCYFTTPIHKDLYFHNRKMHQKTILLCIMCKSNFYTYSELLCHMCPGCYDSSYEAKFRCCLCQVDSIPSAFRLMVHLRKTHHACDVCLETCLNQSKLSNHVWKHKLHHLCYRCGIAYRNKTDISNHLFWKHGTESVLCKKCLQKKWSHIYHFCMPPTTFTCEECSQTFSKAIFLKVHKRFHTGEFKHECKEIDCVEKFVSKKLLEKHILNHQEPPEEQKCPSPKQIIELQKNLEVDPVLKVEVLPPNEEKPLSLNEEIVVEDESRKMRKIKKKELKDNLLMDVNLPALNLSESDSSDDTEIVADKKINLDISPSSITPSHIKLSDNDRLTELSEDVKAESEQVLGIWDNFKLYQAEVEKHKEPKILVPIMKHVCESDHDYCIIPTDVSDDTTFKNTDQEKIEYKSPDKRRKKHRSPRKKHTRPRSSGGSSSSSSSSDSDSHRSCGSNCSCSSSSGSTSSSSSSDSDSSDSTDEKKATDQFEMSQSKDSDASHNSAIDVTAMEEDPPEPLLQEKKEPIIAESDLITDETETDEDFYDERPQRLSDKNPNDNRSQLTLLAAVTPGTSIAVTPIVKKSVKTELSRKKTKTKKRKKLKAAPKPEVPPLRLNIPKQMVIQQTAEPIKPILLPNKITISLQSNTVHIPNPPALLMTKPSSTLEKEKKRASKRRRVPNKFYGYSSDEEFSLKPQLPPKLEWRKEDLPSPGSSQLPVEYKVTIAPPPPPPRQPTPEPVIPLLKPVEVSGRRRVDSVYSSDSDSSGEEGALQICQPIPKLNIRLPPPPVAIVTQPLRATTSALQYPLVRPAGFRQAREGESVYCYCRCPYDEVSEMIACDDENCAIEWFHFECVGIMVPPKGKWYCPDCRLKYGNATVLIH